MSRSPSGSFNGGRLSMAEKARRSCGCMACPGGNGAKGCRVTVTLSNEREPVCTAARATRWPVCDSL
jgi:hypothetical protein